MTKTSFSSSPSPSAAVFLDLAMQLNQGKFEYNGSCGYVTININIKHTSHLLHLRRII